MGPPGEANLSPLNTDTWVVVFFFRQCCDLVGIAHRADKVFKREGLRYLLNTIFKYKLPVV